MRTERDFYCDYCGTGADDHAGHTQDCIRLQAQTWVDENYPKTRVDAYLAGYEACKKELKLAE